MPPVLYGSVLSPFVRRIRMLLEGVDYELRNADVLQADTRAEYAQVTPIRKMPVLVENDQVIFDSHVIAAHLSQQLGLPALTLDQHNQISVIDAVSDSMVILLMGKRSELPVSEDRLIFTLQRERISDSLAWLENAAKAGIFAQWHYPTICLISLIDWARFRGLHDFAEYPAMVAATQKFAERPSVADTAPA
jgi:glutathione S-transferase